MSCAMGDLPFLFRAQARQCTIFGSQFTAALLERAVRDLEEGGPLTALVAGRDWRPADALPLRFAGAVHAAALRDADFGALYPPACGEWDIERIWAHTCDLMTRDPDFFAAFLRHAPQTNETRRTLALLPAFLHVANGAAPLHMLEIGASAGLNQSWDKFSYHTQTWRWGAGAPPLIDTDWRGPAPAYLGPLNVVSRAGCDLNPMDARDPAMRARLKAFIWADQPERIARFDAAADLAIARDVRIDREDAVTWVARKLAALPEGVTILYHSIVWQYLPAETAARITAAIEEAGARATPERRLAWVRFELDPVLLPSGEYECDVDVRAWPGGALTKIARADPHVRWVRTV